MSAKANYGGNYFVACAELDSAIKLLIEAKSKVKEYGLNYSLAGLREPINPAVEPEPVYPPDPDNYDELINKAVAKEILREYNLANEASLENGIISGIHGTKGIAGMRVIYIFHIIIQNFIKIMVQ